MAKFARLQSSTTLIRTVQPVPSLLNVAGFFVTLLTYEVLSIYLGYQKIVTIGCIMDNEVTKQDVEELLVTSKVRSGVYDVLDRMDNRFNIERAGENYDGDIWHLFRETTYERKYYNDFATLFDAQCAIVRIYRTIIDEMDKTDAMNAVPKPKKVILRRCDHCGNEYEAERSSSRFCRPQCRVAANRELKRKNEAVKPLWKAIDALTRQLDIDTPDTHHDAVIALISVKKAIDMNLSWFARWWMCRTCKKQTMTFCPDEKTCNCGEQANWFMVNTSSK